MITLKTGQVQPISQALTPLIKDDSITKNQKYWFFRFLAKFESEMTSWDKIYMELVNKYALKENGEVVKEGAGIKLGDISGFQNELKDISEQDITIDLNKIVIPESELPNSITSQQMYILKDIIDFIDVSELPKEPKPPLQIIT